MIFCSWGRGVGYQVNGTLEPCPHRAVQRVMIHGPNDAKIPLQLCDRHYVVILRETDAHA